MVTHYLGTQSFEEIWETVFQQIALLTEASEQNGKAPTGFRKDAGPEYRTSTSEETHLTLMGMFSITVSPQQHTQSV